MESPQTISHRFSEELKQTEKLGVSALEYYGDNDLAIDVLRNKYLAPFETGPQHVWERVARAMASVEQDVDFWYSTFLSLLTNFKFIPGGRVMHGAGREDAKRKPTLSNCYVVPIEEDSLEGIYRCLAESAMVYRTGGGVGTDLSILRPKGAIVNATVDASPGCTAFMNLLSESTNAVSQAGRRGALMLTLRVDHPDIEDFITIKNDENRTKVQYANISVLITHKFMEAVLSDSDFDLEFKGKVYRTIKAKELWTKIIGNAHASAEPGIIFWDTMRDYHNVEYVNPISSTNPCVTGDTLVYTDGGLIPIYRLAAGEQHNAMLDRRKTAGTYYGDKAPIRKAWESGIKPVFKIETKEGYTARLTEDHKIQTDRGWVKARNLIEDDRIHLYDGIGGFGIGGSLEEGRLVGWMIADGTYTHTGGKSASLEFWGEKKELADTFCGYVNSFIDDWTDEKAPREYDPITVSHIPERDTCRIGSVRLARYLEETWELTRENKTGGLPLPVMRASRVFQQGLLQSLFSADGTVAKENEKKNRNLRLTSISISLLEDVQKLLLNFGIKSSLYKNRREAGKKEWPDGKIYESKELHELNISGVDMVNFRNEIDLILISKQEKLMQGINSYTKGPYLKSFTARFKELVPDGEEMVYDLTEDFTNSFCANGLVVSNCAEQPLSSYTACNLGNLNLASFVE